MKKFFILFFVNLVLVLLQLSFFGELFSGSFVPNLVLALAFALAFSELADFGKMSALAGGLLLDLLGFNIIGFSPTVIISCLIIYDLIRRNVSKNVILSSFVVIISSLVYDKLLGISPTFFAPQAIKSALVTFAAWGIFYLLTSNISTYLAKSGYKISE